MAPEQDLPNARFEHVYPIVRVDPPVESVNPENHIMVVKVFRTKPAADAEAQRLNKVNKDKHCRYFVAISRMIPV